MTIEKELTRIAASIRRRSAVHEDVMRLLEEAERMQDALKLIRRGTWTARNSIDTITWIADQALRGEWRPDGPDPHQSGGFRE